MEQNEIIRETQIHESAAKALTERGSYEEAFELILNILEKYPQSPIYGLGFRIAREMSAIGIADQLIQVLSDRKVLNWAIIAEQAATTAALGDRAEARRLLDVASKMPNSTARKLQPFRDRIEVYDDKILEVDENEIEKSKLYSSSLLKLKGGDLEAGAGEFLTFLSKTSQIKPRMINEFVRNFPEDADQGQILEISGFIADLNQTMADLFLSTFIEKLRKSSKIEKALNISREIVQQDSSHPDLGLMYCSILIEQGLIDEALSAMRNLERVIGLKNFSDSQINQIFRDFKKSLKTSEYASFISEFDSLSIDDDEFVYYETERQNSFESPNDGMFKVPNDNSQNWDDLLENFLTKAIPTDIATDTSWVKGFLNELERIIETPTSRENFIERLFRELGKRDRNHYVPILESAILTTNIDLTTDHYATIMHGWAIKGNVRKVEEAFSKILAKKMLLDGSHISALVIAYSRAGFPEKAESYLPWLDKIGIRSTCKFHYGPIIESYRYKSDPRSIERLIREMENRGCLPDTYVMNAYFTTLTNTNELSRVIEYFQRFKKMNVPLDNYVYTPYLLALARLKRADLLTDALEEMNSLKLEVNSRHLTQAVICYSGVGSEDQVRKIWELSITNPENIDSQLFLSFLKAAKKNNWKDLHSLVTESAKSQINRLDHSLIKAMLSNTLEENNVQALIEIIGAQIDCGSTPNDAHEDYLIKAIGCGSDNSILEFVSSRLEFDKRFLDRINTFSAYCEEIEKGNFESIVKCTEQILIRDDFRIFHLHAMLGMLSKTSFWFPMSMILKKLEIGGTLKSSEMSELLNVASRTGDPLIVENLFRSFREKNNWDLKTITFFHNLVMRSYLMAGKPEDVVRLHDEMIEAGLPLDSYSLSYLNFAYDLNGRFKEGEVPNGDNPDNIEWLNLSTVLDDVVHELSQWIGGLGSLVPATITLTNREPKIDQSIKANLLKMTGMVKNLADRIDEYSAITKTDSSKLSCDLLSSIDWVVERKSPDAHRHLVRIHVNNDRRNENVAVKISPFMFRIALRALVGNAIEALSVKDDDGPRDLWITTTQNHENDIDYANIFVRDNGFGIPSGLLPEIFEKGFTTKRERGLGLGLSLVRTVILSAGGLISVTSNDGRGAEFWIKLPIERSELDG
jgi:pentatricopeptide repeat protein